MTTRAPAFAVSLALAAPTFAQTMQRVSEAADGTPAKDNADYPSIASDGRSVAFDSAADNLVPVPIHHIQQVFVKDMVSGAIVLASADDLGHAGDRYSRNPSFSADGTLVVFESAATNLSNQDDDSTVDLFVHDLVNATTRYLIGPAAHPRLSADGRFVAFESDAPFDSNDKNTLTDVYVFDLQQGTVVLASGDASGATLHFDSIEPAISADGRFVAFTTSGPLDPNDANRRLDIYVRDLVNGVTTRASTASDGSEENDYSRYPSISGDGTQVVFMSLASNLVPGDTNAIEDCFVKNLVSGAVTRVSVASNGAEGNGRSLTPVISGDGTTVVFVSDARNLVDVDPGYGEVYVHHLPTGVTHLISVNDQGDPADLGGVVPCLTDDGLDVAFWSEATNLDPDTRGSPRQSYVRHRPYAAASTQNYGSGFAGALGVPALSASGAPRLNSNLTLGADDSSGVATVGLLLLGLSETSLPLSHGTLLVDPLYTLPLVVPPTGWSATFAVPYQESWVGSTAYAQVFELDAGAVGGIAMTQGLELVGGY